MLNIHDVLIQKCNPVPFIMNRNQRKQTYTKKGGNIPLYKFTIIFNKLYDSMQNKRLFEIVFYDYL